jgi:hypothetical protein
VLGLVKYDSHDGLTCSDWAVNLSVDFIYGNRIPFSDECIENILAKILTFNSHFF